MNKQFLRLCFPNDLNQWFLTLFSTDPLWEYNRAYGFMCKLPKCLRSSGICGSQMSTVLNSARIFNISFKRYLSTGKLPPEIVVPMNREMIVCWHPQPEFPYEYSLPLPEKKQLSSNSALCIGEKEIAETFKHKRPEVIIEELSKITYTTKHRWYPRNWARRNRFTQPDRTYL